MTEFLVSITIVIIFVTFVFWWPHRCERCGSLRTLTWRRYLGYPDAANAHLFPNQYCFACIDWVVYDLVGQARQVAGTYSGEVAWSHYYKHRPEKRPKPDWKKSGASC